MRRLQQEHPRRFSKLIISRGRRPYDGSNPAAGRSSLSSFLRISFVAAGTMTVIFVARILLNPSIGMSLLPKQSELESPYYGIDNDGNNKRRDSHIAIFFNTYRPMGNPKYTNRASRIIQSQLDIVRRQPLLANSTMFYTRFGDYKTEPSPFTEYCSHFNVTEHHHHDGDFAMTILQQTSNTTTNNNNNHTITTSDGKMQCIEIASQSEGGENITLQAMYEYCIHNENDRVLYMHSKGTYTASSQNDRLRELLMKAIVSDECLQLKDPDDPSLEGARNNDTDDDNVNATTTTTTTHHHHQCDACSYQFSMWPFISYAGNMFVARCSYIRTLIPPSAFEGKKRALVQRLHNSSKVVHPGRRPAVTVTVNLTTPSTGVSPINPVSSVNDDNENNSSSSNTSSAVDETIQFHFLEQQSFQFYRDSWLGVDRFAMEHWLGSSPNFWPCEVFSKVDGNSPMGYKNPASLNISALIPRLRHAPPVPHHTQDHRPNVAFIDLYQLKGRLFTYQELYGMVPDVNDSWINRYMADEPPS